MNLIRRKFLRTLSAFFPFGLTNFPIAPPGGAHPVSMTLAGQSSGTVSVTLNASNAGATVGTIAVTMSSGTFSGTLSLSGADAASFGISGHTLIVGSNSLTAGTYSVSVTATQNGTFTQAYTVSVSIAAAGHPVSIAVNGQTSGTLSSSLSAVNIGTPIGIVVVTMSDASTFSGSLSLSGADAALFAISGSNIVVGGTSLTAGSYSITVTATQNGSVQASYTVSVSIVSGMVATLTIPAQSAVPSGGTFTFAESAGTQLDPWPDPRGIFTLTLKQVTRGDLPAFRVIFVRSNDGQWASVEFWYGDSTISSPLHMSAGYDATVTGDFAGASSTPNHWWGARWRVSGNVANGLRPARNDWPYALTAYSTLVSDNLIPQFDPVQTGGRAPPPTPPPYTPMGHSLVTTGMGSTGGRPDIGLFNEWSCYYFLTQAPTASGTWQAQAATARSWLEYINEAGASIPWFIYDPGHGCMWERLVNHSSAGNPPTGPTQSLMPIICTGPVGAQLCGSVRDSNDPTSFWFVDPSQTVKIPSSGTVTVTARFPGQHLPTGYPIVSNTDPPGDPNIVYTWGDPTQFVASSPWGIDSAHQPELGYLSFLLFRDPWDLHTIQADAIWSCNASTQNYPHFSIGQPRQAAWDYAHAFQAWAATPTNAPSWLLPKTTLDSWIRVIQQYIFAHIIDHQTPGLEGLATVFHSIYFYTTALPFKLNDGTQLTPANTITDFWEDAFFCQSASFAVIVRQGDADTLRIANYISQGLGDRFGGNPDWPSGARTIYQARTCSDSNIAYTSLAACWADYKSQYWAWVDTGNTYIPSPLPADPIGASGMNVTQSNQDYPTGDFAALSLAVQAGISVVSQRNLLATACVPAGVNYNRAFAQV